MSDIGLRRSPGLPQGAGIRAALVLASLLGPALTSTAASAQVAFVDGGPIDCSVDAGCGNPYLACVNICGGADAAFTSLPGAADANCPAGSPVDLCVPTYELPCKTNSDCGPAGFICEDAGAICPAGGGLACVPLPGCRAQSTLCSSDNDCPTGWSCYSPTGGQGEVSGREGGGAEMACYPPFAMFNGGQSGQGPAPDLDAGTGGGDSGSAPVVAPTRTSKGGDGCGLASGPEPSGGAWLLPLLAVVMRRRSSA
jgi:hypothetical protein